MKHILLTIAAASAMLAGCSSVCSVKVDRMTCEYIENPMGLDVRSPRFSWTLEASNPDSYGHRQTAYMIEVSALLPSGKKSVQWNTGWVESDDTQLIPYEGKPLRSDTDYLWRVKVKDEAGIESCWSKAGKWSTGLFDRTDWTAEWIGSDEIFDPAVEPDCNISDPWFRKTVALEKTPSKAVMFVASLGYHELYVNGEKIGEDVLAPVVTDHSKRARYVAYDIAPFLKKGENVIGLWLGASWSVYAGYKTDDKPQTPMVLAQADVYCQGDEDAFFRIVTDHTWKTHPSPNKLLGKWGMGSMGGELYDARKENPCWASLSCDESGWKPVTVYEPVLEVTATATYPNRKDIPITPIEIEEMPNGDFRVDMGTNFAGWVEIDVSGNPGDTIDFLYSEREYMEMTFRNYSAYVIGESGRGTFRNRFNYGAGRWITIKGLKEKPELSDIRGWLVRTVHPRTTEFTCSDDLQNWIYDRVKWTFENLSIGGYIVDCPQRERLGYGDAAYISCETGMFNYALGSLYTKWMQDWRDAQGRESNIGPRVGGGVLPHTAPTNDGGGGPAWGGITVMLPWFMYRYYGDERILEENYDMISRWLEFLESHVQDGILRRFGGPWDFLADWLWPGATAEGMNNDKPEAECFNSCYYALNLSTAAAIADVLGLKKDCRKWTAMAERTRRAVHRTFYDKEDSSYCDGSMSNLTVALLADVPPTGCRQAVSERLENMILKDCSGHIDVGITGGAMLFMLLRAEGRDDLLWSMTSQTDYPGWGYMKASGATTIWEMWEKDLPGHSLLHSSFLFPGAWYMSGIGGIRMSDDSQGFRHFILRAPDLPQLDSAEVSYDSFSGLIESEWSRNDGLLRYNVTVPPNTSATVMIPAREDVVVNERSGHAEYLGIADGCHCYAVSSGYYGFIEVRPTD